MAKTFTFTVDNVGNPEPVTVQEPYRQVVIRENASPPTTDYFVRQPLATSPQVRKFQGETTGFDAGPGNVFLPGQIVAYVETVTGSVIFSQEES